MFSLHEASGSGTANVFDDGPPVSNSGSTFDSIDPDMFFSALDLTRPGSFGADANATGVSFITSVEGGMFVKVKLGVSYSGSPFTGGDNPGGTAEGELSSVIEFTMPADEIDWTYGLRVLDTIEFEGSANVVFENVTQSQTLVTLTEDTPLFETTLFGNTGDLMRITTMMSGSGTSPGGAWWHSSDLVMIFTVPEPGTLSLVAIVVPLVVRRRTRGRTS